MNKIIRHPRGDRRDSGATNGATEIQTGTVYVVFTSTDSTLAAMRAGHDLAKALDASITVLRFRAVPYVLPLSERTAIQDPEIDAFASTLEEAGIDASVRTYLCRSDRDAAAVTLPPRSLVVVGDRRAGWPFTRAAGWRRRLEAMGHAVLLIHAGAGPRTAVLEPVHTKAVLPADRGGVAGFSRAFAGHSLKERARA